LRLRIKPQAAFCFLGALKALNPCILDTHQATARFEAECQPVRHSDTRNSLLSLLLLPHLRDRAINQVALHAGMELRLIG
jgi:hypothetical protein